MIFTIEVVNYEQNRKNMIELAKKLNLRLTFARIGKEFHVFALS